MTRIWVLLVLHFILRTTISADEVESKADNMAKAIAQQNKKVEEESDAMEKAIDEKGKQVDTKEQEDKFKKASERVDAVGDAAEGKFEQKANLVDKLATDANSAIESQAKKVEELGSQANLSEDNASNLVDKIGKQIEKETTGSTEPKSRTSISYMVQVPKEPHADQMIQKASDYSKDYDDLIQSNQEAIRTYPWPGSYKPSTPYDNQGEEMTSDINTKAFEDNNVKVENDALESEGYEVSPSARRNIRKLFYMSHLPFRFPHYRRHGRRHHHRRPEKALSVPPTAKSSDVGLFVLPSGGPRLLSPDIKNQLEDDQLLRKTAREPLKNDEDMDITNELKTSATAENDVERQWMKINGLGSQELKMQWPHASRKFGAIGEQKVSLVSPGEVDLLQTAYPDFNEPRSMGGRDLLAITRSKIKKKIAVASKKAKT